MWILIWRGWGILVIPIVAVGFAVAMAITIALQSSGLPEHWQDAIGVAVGSVGAGLSIWYIAKAISGKVVRRLVDPNTGKDVLFRRSAGSLFFIPTRYWAFIVIVPGLALSALLAVGPVKVPVKEAPSSMQSDMAQSQ